MHTTTRKTNYASRRFGSDTLREQTAYWLRQFVDAAIVGMILVAPLFMGGRGPVGKLVFVGLVSATAIGWFAQQVVRSDGKWRWSGAEPIILLAGLLVLAQLTPLPQAILDRISPAIGELLPLWRHDAQPAVQLGVWSTLSLTPEETRGGLAMLLAYAMLFIVVIQRLESTDDVQWLLKWVALGAMSMATLGMMQLLFGNGKFLWIYDHPSRDTLAKVNGTFQNQNHFAHFLALGVGPVIWWIQRTSASRRSDSEEKSTKRGSWSIDAYGRYALPVGLGIVIVASLLTYSRGGVLSVGLAIGLTIVLYFLKSLLGRKSLLAVGVFGGIITAALAIYGFDRLALRMGSLASGSLTQIDSARLELWKAQWEAIPRFAMLGAGIGSHRDVYPIYMEEQYDLEFAYGENGYFQLLLETGFSGLSLLLMGFAIAIRCCLTPLIAQGTRGRLVAMAGAILPGIVVSLFHSWGDFVWYIPSCMTLTLLLAACACRVHQIARAERATHSHAPKDEQAATRRVRSAIPIPQWLTAAFAILATACGVTIIGYFTRPAMASASWDAYLRLALASHASSTPGSSEERERLDAMERHLDEVTRRHPTNARAQLRMVAAKLRRFELEQQSATNPIGLSQIRDAALASAFPSKEAQESWLKVAVGENRLLLHEALRHCRQALRLSPLQGPGYVFLAELSFLENPREIAKREFVEQAIRVRPHSGHTLFAMGKELALAGDLAHAIEHWRHAFQKDPEVQSLIIESLAGQMPVDLFVTSFEPDLVGLRRLYAHYRQQGPEPDARFVGERLVTAVLQDIPEKDPLQAAYRWHEAQSVYLWLGQLDQALDCQRRAVTLAPQDFELRRALANLLIQFDEYADAARHLEWCMRRRPDDADLRQQLAEVRLRESHPARTAEKSSNSSPRGF